MHDLDVMAILIYYLQRMPMVHLFSAHYKEQIGDVCAARAAFLGYDTEADSTFIENVTIKANMEKRLVCNLLFNH